MNQSINTFCYQIFVIAYQLASGFPMLQWTELGARLCPRCPQSPYPPSIIAQHQHFYHIRFNVLVSLRVIATGILDILKAKFALNYRSRFLLNISKAKLIEEISNIKRNMVIARILVIDELNLCVLTDEYIEIIKVVMAEFYRVRATVPKMFVIKLFHFIKQAQQLAFETIKLFLVFRLFFLEFQDSLIVLLTKELHQIGFAWNELRHINLMEFKCLFDDAFHEPVFYLKNIWTKRMFGILYKLLDSIIFRKMQHFWGNSRLSQYLQNLVLFDAVETLPKQSKYKRWQLPGCYFQGQVCHPHQGFQLDFLFLIEGEMRLNYCWNLLIRYLIHLIQMLISLYDIFQDKLSITALVNSVVFALPPISPVNHFPSFITLNTESQIFLA